MREMHKAWSTLFAEKGASLSHYFRQRVTHRWDAQDLVQEVYLRLLRIGPADAASIRNPEAYLFTVAANLLKEYGALRQAQPQGGDALDEAGHAAVPCAAEAHADGQLRRERLAALLARLSPKCRAVMIMHYRDDMPYRDIAERLQISTNMVKKYIVKGLAACRQGMASYE